MKEWTVQRFLQKCFSNYQATHGLPLYQIQAAEKLMSCRTERLGGHAAYCEEGHLNGIWYNSCKHRSCPQCSAMKSEQWLQGTESKLLKCQHHHWVFTLPHALHPIWNFNRELCQQLLFESVRKTLQQLSKDEKYLGATPGCMLALHTWARNQVFHPHIHCLISHGGLDINGDWKTPRRKSFLPAKPMMQLFRGKYLAGLKRALKKGLLVIPAEMSQQGIINLCNKYGRQDWVVYCVKPYEYGDGVAKYLAKYIRGGSIKSSQIINMTEQTVKFRYKSHQTKQVEYLTLSHSDFMKRLLSHMALPKKQQYQFIGLYHSHCRNKLNIARSLLGQRPVMDVGKVSWQQYLRLQGKQARCVTCGKPISQLKRLESEMEVKQLKLALI